MEEGGEKRKSGFDVGPEGDAKAPRLDDGDAPPAPAAAADPAMEAARAAAAAAAASIVAMRTAEFRRTGEFRDGRFEFPDALDWETWSTRRATAAAPYASPSLIAAALPAIAPHCTYRELVRLTAACRELRKVERST